MNGIIRVFPKITSFTPTDEMVYADCPGFKDGGYIPEHREVHVCCVFTWDKPMAERLYCEWQQMTNKPVKLGGPAYDDPDWDIEEIRKLRIKELWLACDSDGNIKTTTKAITRLVKAGFTDRKGNPARDKIHCYALIGDDMAKNEARLRAIFECGALPFAQLYQPADRIEYSSEWKQFAATWSRPAATMAHMKKVCNV